MDLNKKQWSSLSDAWKGVDISQSMVDAARIMTEGIDASITFSNKISDVLNRAATRKERFDLTVMWSKPFKRA